MKRVHVSPVDDWIEHDVQGDDCICGPDIEFLEGAMLIIHNSLDGREQHEYKQAS